MRSVGASGRHCIVYAISGHGCSPLRCRGTHPYGASRKFERYSPECVEKLSEKSRRHPKLGLRRHPKGTVRPVLVPEQRPNPRSEHCSYPFSDSFGRGILRSSSLEGSRNSSSSQEPRYFGQAFLTRPPPAHSRLPQRHPCQRRRYQCLGRNSVTNEIGGSFYEALGYRQAYVMPEYYDEGIDGVTYLKLFPK